MKGGFATYSSDSSGPPSHAVVLIRKQIQGSIINGWLVLITILGAIITVGDGLTRTPDPALDPAPLQPLEYEPYHAAFLLAAVTLPLMFAYAKKARVSLTEGLFLWFTLCTTAYMRDFSYLRLPGVPLFVTDAVLVLLLFSTYILPRPRYPHTSLMLNILFVLFTAAGLISATRGFWEHRDSMLVLRDSALIVYSFFLLVGYHLFRSWRSIKRLAVWFLLGTGLSILNGMAWFVVAPGQRRFIFPGIYVLVALIGVLVMMSNRIIPPQLGWICTGIFSLGLLLANARSLFVSLSIVLVMALLVPRLLHGKMRLASIVATLVLGTVLACSFAFLFSRMQTGRDFTTRVAGELDSGVLHSGEDPYWQFRLWAWKEAWRRFEEYPPGGEGFGIPFAFEIWDNDSRPHNTFLTVLYKMGLIGFTPLFALLGYFFWSVSAALHRHRKKRRALFLQVAGVVQIVLCLYGMANLVLESPHLAALFWTAIGVDLRMIRMLDLEQLLQKRANSFGASRFLVESPSGAQ